MNILVVGGAGFIGCNTAEYYLKKGDEVTVLDNLSRNGTTLNLGYLKKNYPQVKFVHCDIRHYYDLLETFNTHRFDVVFHLAAQVAVTTSVTNPREDFDINALGTFNILEAMRETGSEALIVFASTNKVYGGMEHIGIELRDGRYQYSSLENGISERNQLDFHSPYGCSKGAAEQYVRDYYRIYGIKSTVFRQSCIYGYRQFGIEDQGWVAWFTIAVALNKKLTIYGDGRQVRDVLFVDDLVRAYDMAVNAPEKVNGKIFNIGGGKFQMSLLELLSFLETFSGHKIEVKYGDWRPGDQKVYISDNQKAKQDFDWEPTTDVETGVKKLFDWVRENRQIFDQFSFLD
jgi:CDP-paratose 2-epimerase